MTQLMIAELRIVRRNTRIGVPRNRSMLASPA
jgi:hypothetical protein